MDLKNCGVMVLIFVKLRPCNIPNHLRMGQSFIPLKLLLRGRVFIVDSNDFTSVKKAKAKAEEGCRLKVKGICLNEVFLKYMMLNGNIWQSRDTI